MRKTHGYRPRGKASRTYVVWREMRARCRNPSHAAYRNYGGRGIAVCPEWEAFPAFLADMGEAPVGLTLDRRDNDGGYNKENCRWATYTQQNQNSRQTRMITLNGDSKCLSDWARTLHIDNSSLAYRLHKWGIERALSAPVTLGGRGTSGGRHAG